MEIEHKEIQIEKILKKGEIINLDPNAKIEPVVIEEPPETYDKHNIIFWSSHYKKLEGVEHGNGIRTKARKFLSLECIEYVKKENGGPYYICKPIKGYNNSTYKMFPIGREFNCSCQFYNKVCIQNPGLICSHILALYMQIKIWNSEKKQKEINNSVDLV